MTSQGESFQSTGLFKEESCEEQIELIETESQGECIEYVQYLDEADYEITAEDGQQVIIDDESFQHVEYIEAQQIDLNGKGEVLATEVGDGTLLEGHTLVEHNGRQYMIPNELQQSGHTILLQDWEQNDEDDLLVEPEQEQQHYILTQQDGEIEVCEEACKELEVSELNYTYGVECTQGEDEEAEESQSQVKEESPADDDEVRMQQDSDEQYMGEVPGRRYAVLRDGRLHLEGGELGEQDELHPQLQLLEDSLFMADDQDEEDDAVQITGKNLITGQTISLQGFLDKLRRKSEQLTGAKRVAAEDSCYPSSVKRQRRNFYNQQGGRSHAHASPRPDYMLMPPLQNKKVLVGKTSDGKNIVGKILQIWKKVDPNTPQPKPRHVRKKPLLQGAKPEETAQKVEELIIDNTGKILRVDKPAPKNVVFKKKYVSKEFLVETIEKTLSGLMDLESIQKTFSQKNLIIKHILKKSLDGKIQPQKEVTLYYGHMEKRDTVDQFNEMKTEWSFVPDYREEPEKPSSGEIDVTASRDTQQVDLQKGMWSPERIEEKRIKRFTETLSVNLIVVEDEFGKKRTKVTIPQAGGTPKCPICQKLFRSESHLHRHMAGHGGGAKAVCEVCGRTYEDEAALSRHWAAAHGGGGGEPEDGPSPAAAGEHACYVCEKSFTSAASLRRHVTVHDHSLRPLQCLVCFGRFTDESSLRKHIVTHTGIKAFQCPTCLRRFAHHGDLNFHRKIHELVKRYQCATCGKEFNRYSNMVRHSDIHRTPGGGGGGDARVVEGGEGAPGTAQPPFTCEMCGCHYNFMSSLTRHIVNKHIRQLGAAPSRGEPAETDDAVAALAEDT